MAKDKWFKIADQTRLAAKKYKKIVIWGLRSRSGDSFRYIMDHYSATLKKLEIPSVWVDDNKGNHRLVDKGDLVIAANVAGKNIPLKSGVNYCLHNFDKVVYQNLDSKRILILQAYTDDARHRDVKFWDPVTCFDKKSRVLYQPWGTNLLPWEFMEPVFHKNSPFVFWVGSVWDNEQHQGNLEVINDLKKAISKYKLKFVQTRVPDILAVKLMRASRIAPAVGGLWQAKVNYLPCRMFKNISYGQLGITNIRRFKDLLGSSFVKGESIEELVDTSLSMSKIQYREQTLAQQEIMKDQTYMQKLLNVFTALNEIQ